MVETKENRRTKDMTRSERRKVQFEEFKKKESEKQKRLCTLKTILRNCKECEHCKIVVTDQFDNITVRLWSCRVKARRNLKIHQNHDVDFIPSGYTFVSGKCNLLGLMVLEDNL